MAALHSSFLTDPFPQPDEDPDPDIARAERQLAELESRPWRSEEGRLEIRRQIDVLRFHLARMRAAA